MILALAGFVAAIIGITVEYIELSQSETLLVPRNSTVMYDITYQTWLYKSMTVSMDEISVSEHDTVQLVIHHYNHNSVFFNHMRISKNITSNLDSDKVVRYWPNQVTGTIQYDPAKVKLCYYWKSIDDAPVVDSDEVCSVRVSQDIHCNANSTIKSMLNRKGSKQTIIFLQFCLTNTEQAQVALNITEALIIPNTDNYRNYYLTKTSAKKLVPFADLLTELSRSTQLYITDTKQDINDDDFRPIFITISYTAGIGIIESMIIIVVVLILLTLWMCGVCCCKRVYGTIDVLK